MAKEIIHTDDAPKAVGPYVQAVKTGGVIYCSGQLGLNPENGKLCEGVEAQAHQSLKNLGAVLKEAGSSYGKVIKTSIFLADMDDFAVVNGIYSEYFKENAPARACVEVARLPKDVLLEMEAIAVR